MADWLNHAAVATPRDGTNNHTVGPTGSGGTVVDGSGFTATAGRLLVVFAEGPVTSTTPSGWTLPTNGSAINNTGLYVWHRTAAGSDTLSTTHNSSNFPVIFDFYEFASGSTFVGSASATSVASGVASPTLSGLTGTNWTAGVMGLGLTSGAQLDLVGWDTGVEEIEFSEAPAATDGYGYSLVYTDDNTAASQAYGASVSGTSLPSQERLVVAVNVGAGGDPPAPFPVAPVWRMSSTSYMIR